MDDNFKVRTIDQIQMAKFKKVIDHIRDISYILTDDYSVNVPGDISIDIHGSFKIVKNENAIEVELIDLDPRHKSYMDDRRGHPNEEGYSFRKKFFVSEIYEEFKDRLTEFCNRNGYKIQEYNKGFFIIGLKENKNEIKTFESFDFVEDKLEKFVEYFKSVEYILFDDFNNISFDIKLLPILSIPSYSVSGNKMIQISMTSIIGKLSDAEIADIDIDPLTLNIPLYTSNKYRGRMMIKSKSFNDNLRSSDQYIEFIDRLENYCDENGLIFENTHTNGGFFRIFVKKTENHR